MNSTEKPISFQAKQELLAHQTKELQERLRIEIRVIEQDLANQKPGTIRKQRLEKQYKMLLNKLKASVILRGSY